VASLLKEIELQETYLQEPVSTIYFGGGTPSILPVEEIEKILRKLSDTFNVEPDAEITLEANPDDVCATTLYGWKTVGINRLSIGIQSFFEEDLLWMNRAHSATQALECIPLAQKNGFHNLTIDLIYGTPTLSDERWKQNVEKALQLNIPHLSCYALTVEPHTPLDKMIRQKKLANVEMDKQARHFEMLINWLNEANYEHYEISNFARPGYRSRHNSSYWQARPYLGVGPSAHSYNSATRQWNIANNALYIDSLSKNIIPFEIETLTPQQKLNEYIMTSLRTVEGLSLQKVENEFGNKAIQQILKAAQLHINQEFLKNDRQFLSTTNKGKLMADGIAADLFLL
jgi:oxygen-independent coproporphyrinogen-3 oxidase